MSERFWLLLVVAMLGSTPEIFAQDCHVALRGHLYDAETREPLAYATVRVAETGRGATADENGYYVLPDHCEGASYTVSVTHVACEHFTQVVKLVENQAFDFWLSHVAHLQEVTVLERAVAPTPVQASQEVSSSDLAAGQGVNITETMKKLPGVTSINTGATIAKPVIQGLHSNRIALINNQVTLESQQWGSEHAPEIDPFTAGKITVLKGAAGVRYGVGAMGGAILIEPDPLRTEAGWGGWVHGGMFSNGRSGVAAGAVDWKKAEGTLALRFQGTIKRSGNLRAPDYWLGNTGAGEANLSVMAGWQSGRWRHDLSASTFNQKIGILRAAHQGNLTDLMLAIESDTPRNNPNWFTYDIERPYQTVNHQTFQYRTSLRLNEKWKFSGQYSFQYNERKEFDVVRKTSAAAEKPQLLFDLWTNQVNLALEHFPIRHWQGGVGVQGLQQKNLVGKGGLIPDYDTYGGAIWAMERWRKYPNPWEFEVGARYDFRHTNVLTTGNLVDVDTTLVFGNVSGTAGAVYHFSKALSLSLHSGYAWRPPHVNELFARGVHFGSGTYEQGRSDLRPEKGWNTNLTLLHQTRRVEASLSVYHNRIQDFIYLEPQEELVLTVRGAFPAYFFEQDNVVLQGLDGGLSVVLAGQLSAEGRVSLLRAYRVTRDSGENSEKKTWLPLMPSDRFQYGLKWRFGRDEQTTNTHESFVRLLASTTMEQTRLPQEGLLKPAPETFTVLSLEVVHTFAVGKKTLEIGLNVQNLSNQRYREYLNFFRFYADEPGINAGLRAKLTF